MAMPTPNDDELIGTNESDTIYALGGNDLVVALGGDDVVYGGPGNDDLRGGAGFDFLAGNAGDDRIFGGMDGDIIKGGSGGDRLFGDMGLGTAKGSDLSADRLDGGDGNDTLFQGDGNDTFTGGGGFDTFRFSFSDPKVALAAMTGPAFTAITDFDPSQDTLAFDVAGLGLDHTSANFVNNGDGSAGSAVTSFFRGDTADTNGEDVMVLTDQAFATGADAVLAANGEELGDFVLYYNSTVNVGSLLHVSAPDMATSIARFTDINSLEQFQNTNFTASDFIFV